MYTVSVSDIETDIMDISAKCISDTLSNILGIDSAEFARYVEEGRLISRDIDRRLEAKVGRRFVPGALSPDKRPYLYTIVKALNPEKAVETGVHVGVSTTVILSALNRGMLYSIDIRRTIEEPFEPTLNGLEVGFLVPEELRQRWRLIIGDSRKVLRKLLDELGEIQFFMHDSEHTYETVMFELTEAWNHMRRGVLLVDNFERNDATIDFAKKVGAKVFVLSRFAGGMAMIAKNMQ